MGLEIFWTWHASQPLRVRQLRDGDGDQELLKAVNEASVRLVYRYKPVLEIEVATPVLAW